MGHTLAGGRTTELGEARVRRPSLILCCVAFGGDLGYVSEDFGVKGRGLRKLRIGGMKMGENGKKGVEIAEIGQKMA